VVAGNPARRVASLRTEPPPAEPGAIRAGARGNLADDAGRRSLEGRAS
jgi:hypothetical protein